MCGRLRANERFSGRGHRDHVCKECQRLPAAEKERRRALIDMAGMLEQSRISEKNVRYLHSLAASPTAEVAEWAAVLLEIARLHPGRRHRLGHLKRHPDLWARMHRLGIVEQYQPGGEDLLVDEVELVGTLDEADREDGLSPEELFDQLRKHGFLWQ
jgi:hypothetical protein